MSDLRTHFSLPHFQLPIHDKQHLSPRKRTNNYFVVLWLFLSLGLSHKIFRQVSIRSLISQLQSYLAGLFDVVSYLESSFDKILLEAKFLQLLVQGRLARVFLLFLHDLL